MLVLDHEGGSSGHEEQLTSMMGTDEPRRGHPVVLGYQKTPPSQGEAISTIERVKMGFLE